LERSQLESRAAGSAHLGRPFFNGAFMRPITILIFALLVFLIDLGSASTALSHGAIALCTRGRFTIALGASKDKPTLEAAQSAARASFVPNTTWGCLAPDRFVSLSDSCVAVTSRGGPFDSSPIEEKHFWIRAALSGQEAVADALAACRSSGWPNCVLNEVVCDGEATSNSAENAKPTTVVPGDDLKEFFRRFGPLEPADKSPPHQAESQVEAVQRPDSIPDRPRFSVEAVVKETPADPLFSLATLNRFIELASRDVRQYVSQHDWEWITLIAATAAVFLFVGTQLYSLMRTGRRRLRDIAFNASGSVLFVLLLAIGWLVGSYAIQKLVGFGSTLSSAGKLLLISVVIGIVLLAIPHAFWRALGKIFSGPHAPVPAPATQPPSTEVTPQSAVEVAVAEPEIEPVSPRTLPAVISQSADVLKPMPPLEGIVLKLKRSQKTGTLGGLIYMLDARIDASQETLSLIAKHKLGNRLIYESEARQKHAAAAQGHLAATRGGPSLLAPASEQAKGAVGTLWNLGRATVSAVIASLALRITVNSLLSGVHVECKDMEELLEAEAAIREAKENLEGFLEAAQTFDGREEIH